MRLDLGFQLQRLKKLEKETSNAEAASLIFSYRLRQHASWFICVAGGSTTFLMSSWLWAKASLGSLAPEPLCTPLHSVVDGFITVNGLKVG